MNPSRFSLPGVSWRLSPQRVDPLGALGSRPITLLGALAVVFYAVLATALQWPQVQSPGFAVAGVLSMTAAAAVFIWASNPPAAPFPSWAQCVVLAFALLGAVCESISRHGSNQLLQDDFGQMCIGVLVLSMAPYRSALWLANGAMASAVILGLQLPLGIDGLTVDAPFAEYLAVVMTPVLALGFAGAVFSDEFVKGVQRWHRSVSRAAIETEQTTRTGVARSVQQQQVSLLSDEVLPFLIRVASERTLDAEDIEQAGALASGLRGTLVREAGRTWLDDVIAGYELTSGEHVQLRDPGSLAAGMSAEQRAALAALVAAVSQPRESQVQSAVLHVQRLGPARCRVLIEARRSLPWDRATGRTLDEYLAVIRVIFARVRVRITGYTVSVQFEYLEQ